MISPFPFPNARMAGHSSDQRTERHIRFCNRLLSQRDKIKEEIRNAASADPDYAARLTSLLLFAEGRPTEAIARITGLSVNSILRVRRRVECWGLACVKDPAPGSSRRTSPLRLTA